MTRATWAAAALLAGTLACRDATEPTPRTLAPAPDSTAGRWPTWVLPDGAALRPAAPPAPDSPEARQELDEVLSRQRSRDADAAKRIARWDGAPSLAWTREAVDLLGFYWPLLPDVRVATPARSARAMALLHVAIHDALVATWDAKYTYRRPPPASDGRVQPVVAVTALPSYPSEHAAAAGAAAAILAYVLPHEDSAALSRLAREAAESRIDAGAAFRSDVEAGLTLGRAVAARVIDRARSDGADAPWSGTVPDGAMLWHPTPPRHVVLPFDGGAGGWRTWVIPSGDAFRPEPPPAPGSAAFDSSLAELRRLSAGRTEPQATIARYWATESPSARWELFMIAELTQRRTSPVRAARAAALASVAAHDAMIACWDGKYHYWLARPITVDPTLVTAFSTPPFPSYPSGHSTMSAALGEVFAELFPDSAAVYRARAEQASLSRVWGGVHFRFDVVAGEELGTKVGKAVVARERALAIR